MSEKSNNTPSVSSPSVEEFKLESKEDLSKNEWPQNELLVKNGASPTPSLNPNVQLPDPNNPSANKVVAFANTLLILCTIAAIVLLIIWWKDLPEWAQITSTCFIFLPPNGFVALPVLLIAGHKAGKF
mgnify:CR=1 FL=1|tara:strand:+ start:4961 stop:5344 length:384 start_codon:yes stop_codon:yes gene_type:complete